MQPKIFVGIEGADAFPVPVAEDATHILINLDQFARAHGYKLVKLDGGTPEPNDHIILGEN